MMKRSRRSRDRKGERKFSILGHFAFNFVLSERAAECVVSRDHKYISALYKVSLVSSQFGVRNLSGLRLYLRQNGD